MQLIIYTIQPNDTLYKIALLYGSTVDSIMSINKITNPNQISPGTIILIPVKEEETATLPSGLIYMVQPGDTLYTISLLFGVSIQDILKSNHIDNPSLIHPGMRIVLPKEAVNPFQPIQPGLIKYTILPGDTIYKIAVRFAVSVQSIKAYTGSRNFNFNSRKCRCNL